MRLIHCQLGIRVTCAPQGAQSAPASKADLLDVVLSLQNSLRGGSEGSAKVPHPCPDARDTDR